MSLDIAFDIVKVFLLFGITIFVHELGHFLAARWFGMTIEVFSIGIGPALWKRNYHGVLYKIGCIPFGGYVALPQMDPTLLEDASGTAVEDRSKTGSAAGAKPQALGVAPSVKMMVAIAGGLGNMLLAVLLAWIIYWTGKPSTPSERCSVIGFVETHSVAYEKGLRTGDEIVTINGRSVSTWSDVLQENARFDEVTLTVKTSQGTRSVRVPTEKSFLGLKMVAGLREVSLCRVMAVEPDSSATRAGVRSGDLIKTFEGVNVLSIEHLISLVSSRANQPTPLVVDRQGQSMELWVTPRLDPTIGRARIGIRFDPMAVDYDKVVYIPPGVQLKTHATVILRVVVSLLTPKEARATSQGLGGPFMILYMLFDMVCRGIIIALWFTCFLNVNLAILNLLPIPILDGGHILFSLLEVIIRRPVHPKIVNGLSRIFAGFIIAVFLLLSGRDLLRINQIRQVSKPAASLPQATNSVAPPAVGTGQQE